MHRKRNNMYRGEERIQTTATQRERKNIARRRHK